MLHIQDPSYSRSYSTHEALVHTCSNSVSGFGAFAFASAKGIELLFEDDEFDRLLERGQYFLIVGIDEITNTASIGALEKIRENRPNLEIKVFLHNERSIFHPKVSFFRDEHGKGQLVIGSGNLTIGGLRQNRECFAMVHLSKEKATAVQEEWQSWLDESGVFLKDLDDPEVLRRASENVRMLLRKNRRQDNGEQPPEPIQEPEAELEPDANWIFTHENKALIAEIPRSGARWKQANFDKGTFENFFGATPGDNSQRVIFRHTLANAELSEFEVRTSVSVRSQNYRFELDAASGLDYPSTGVPIAVFVEISKRFFIYELFMPSSAQHAVLQHWLDSKWTGRQDRKKRIIVTAGDIDHVMAEANLWAFRS